MPGFCCTELPAEVKGLFPKENMEFAKSITSDEAKILQLVFLEHDCFEEIGEMIDAVTEKDAELGGRMAVVLKENCRRLDGLSDAAVDHSKKIIHFVTHVQCILTLHKPACYEKAKELHAQFKDLSVDDQKALQKNNPDVVF